MTTIIRAFLRYLARQRGLSVLQFLGIAFGTAAVVGIGLSARASLASFSGAVDFLSGGATHSLERPAGPLDEAVLRTLMRDPAVVAFSPVLDRWTRLKDGTTIHLLGLDLLLERRIRARLVSMERPAGDRNPEAGLEFFTNPRAVALSDQFAAEHGFKAGDAIETVLGPLEIAGLFPSPSGEPLVVMDIAHVQARLGLPGVLDRVDLVLRDETDFRSRWQSGYRIRSSAERRRALDNMLGAYRLNLEAMSLMALFVGIFLIYNTAMFTVVSRRKDAGILRSLGSFRSELAGAFLSEILLLGTLGGAAGGVLGFFLSRLLTGGVGRTISELYFFLKPAPAAWSWDILAFSVILGGAASLVGSLLSLAELVRVDPARALSGRTADRSSRAKARTTALGGVAVLAAGVLLFYIFPQSIYAGFAGALGFLVGATLLTGFVLDLLDPVLTWIATRLGGIPGRIGAGNIRLNLRRTSVAIAAFLVALTVSIGIGSMIGSFRRTLVWWLNSQITGDLYISSLDKQDVPLDLYREVQAWPGVAAVDPYRNVLISYKDSPAYVSSVDAAVLQKYTNFGFLKGGNENWDPVKAGGAIVSESFFRRFGAGPGATITLNGVKGPAPIRIAAVFYDYTSEHGVVMMDRAEYLRIFEDPTITSLAVFLEPGQPGHGQILSRIKDRAQALELQARTKDELHGAVLQVFDTTFAVTRSMRLLTVIVAFFGIAGAILTLFMERRREFGVYRALGFSTAQLAGMTLAEGLIMSLASFVLSLGLGTAMAAILIRVINLRSFNWTIFFSLSWGPYLLAGLTAVLSGVGATIYPIFKAVRTYPQMQIREE